MTKILQWVFILSLKNEFVKMDHRFVLRVFVWR